MSSTRLITTINTSACTTIKNTGVKIAVLYTTYQPVTSNAFYNSWVAPISSNIPTQLPGLRLAGILFPGQSDQRHLGSHAGSVLLQL